MWRHQNLLSRDDQFYLEVRKCLKGRGGNMDFGLERQSVKKKKFAYSMISHCTSIYWDDLGGSIKNDIYTQLVLWHPEPPECTVEESQRLKKDHICHTYRCLRCEWKWGNKYCTSRRRAGAAWRGPLPVCEQCHGIGTWPQLQTTQPQSHAPLCHWPMRQNPVEIREGRRQWKKKKKTFL